MTALLDHWRVAASLNPAIGAALAGMAVLWVFNVAWLSAGVLGDAVIDFRRRLTWLIKPKTTKKRKRRP